jgi:hypothetical protein
MITSHLENTRRVWKDRMPDPDIALEEEYLQAQVRLAQAKRKNKRKKVSIEDSVPARDRPKACLCRHILPTYTDLCRPPRRQDPPYNMSHLLK